MKLILDKKDSCSNYSVSVGDHTKINFEFKTKLLSNKVCFDVKITQKLPFFNRKRIDHREISIHSNNRQSINGSTTKFIKSSDTLDSLRELSTAINIAVTAVEVYNETQCIDSKFWERFQIVDEQYVATNESDSNNEDDDDDEFNVLSDEESEEDSDED